MGSKIEGIVSKEIQDKISDEILSTHFPWFFNDSTIGQYDKDKKAGFQFIHTVLEDGRIVSPIFDYIKPILESFESSTNLTIKNLIRIKINLLTQLELSNIEIQNTIHTDIAKTSPCTDVVSLVYYVMDSDGDTVVYDGDDILTCSPVKGNAFYFKSVLDHRATNPILNQRRIVINFVMEV
jgi:hypothetical protein